MTAREWQPLHEALQRYVRIPLLSDHEDDWKRLNPRESEFRWSVAEDLVRAHHLAREASRDNVLWYTLLYSCMHFDALHDLMGTNEFKEACGFRDSTMSILHVDFGCGPGTSAWAIMKDLPDTIQLETIGHDHNPHMTNLAKMMVDTISDSASQDVAFDFLSDWRRFQRRVLSNAKTKDLFLVTMNSLFGQQSFTYSELNELTDVIRKLRIKSQRTPVVIFGTHPSWSSRKVVSFWEKIAVDIGASTICAQEREIVSWSPIRYTPDIQSSWNFWDPDPQLARILVLPPAGGKR